MSQLAKVKYLLPIFIFRKLTIIVLYFIAGHPSRDVDNTNDFMSKKPVVEIHIYMVSFLVYNGTNFSKSYTETYRWHHTKVSKKYVLFPTYKLA